MARLEACNNALLAVNGLQEDGWHEALDRLLAGGVWSYEGSNVLPCKIRMHLDLLLCDGQQLLVVGFGVVRHVLQLGLQVVGNFGSIRNPKAVHLLVPHDCQAELGRQPLQQALPNVKSLIRNLQSNLDQRHIACSQFLCRNLVTGALHYKLAYLFHAIQRMQTVFKVWHQLKLVVQLALRRWNVK